MNEALTCENAHHERVSKKYFYRLIYDAVYSLSIGSFSNHDGNAKENFIEKNNSFSLKLRCNCRNSLNFSDVSELSRN